jgi:hypothetical protein
MAKKYLFIVFVLVISTTHVYAQPATIVNKGYEKSYDEIIVGDKIEVTGNSLTEKSIFLYSLNNREIKKFDLTSMQSGRLTLKINTLFLENESNSLEIWFGDKNLISIGTITIKYYKPKIEILTVSQEGVGLLKPIDPIKNVYVVKSENSLKFNLMIKEYTKKDGFEYGDPKILNVRTYLNDKLIDKDTIISTGKLKIGENYIYSIAEGGVQYGSDIIHEYSDTLKMRIFYIDFQLPQSLKNGICRTNKNYSLNGSGLPIDGGFFYGSGIVGNSNEFNPEYGHIGDNEIEYRYLYYGNLISSLPQKVTVNTIPEFSISGIQIVCKNSTDQVYHILSSDKSKNVYVWSLDGGKFLEKSAISATIQWDSKVPSGKVIVYAYIDNSDASCYHEKEFIVHVKDEFATEKSYPVFIDSERKLIACTDISAKSYRWIRKTGNTETILDTTNKPYFVNNAGAQPGEIYYVETADDILSCYSRSYPCDFNNNWNSNKAAYIATNIPDQITEENIRLSMDGDAVQILSKTDLVLTLSLVDISGRNVYQGQFKNLAKLNRSMFAPGPYIITVKSDSNFLFRSLIRL